MGLKLDDWLVIWLKLGGLGLCGLDLFVWVFGCVRFDYL